MKALMDYDFEYGKEFHYLCLKNCIKQVLDFYGVKDSRFYINSIIEMAVDFNPKSKFGFSFMKSNAYCPVIPSKKSGIRINGHKSAIRAWEQNMARASTIPLIALVDAFYLDYRREYMTSHGAHCVLLSGCDPEKKTVHIIDWYEPYFFKGSVGYDLFLKARDSQNEYSRNPFSGYGLYNQWYEVAKDGWDLTKYKGFYESVYYSIHLHEFFAVKQDGSRKLKENALAALHRHVMDMNLKDNPAFWSYLHNELFLLHTGFILFSKNLSLIIEEGNISIAQKDIQFLADYEAAFKKLLFAVLKASTRVNSDLPQKALDCLNEFAARTAGLYEVLSHTEAAMKKCIEDALI